MDEAHTVHTASPAGAGQRAPEWVAAVGRAAIYSFLSRSLLYPTPETRASIATELVPLLGSLSSSSAELDELIAAAVQGIDIDLAELRSAHGRIFTHIENQDCPAHESAYDPGDVFRRADLLADVAAFYRAHGLQIGGGRRERVDHITTELEFMSFLARKEAYARDNLGTDEIEECRRSQAHFLRDHLGCWATGLGDRLQVVADHSCFVAIGSLLSTWVETDLAWFEVEPPARRTEPRAFPVPDDDRCGIDATGTPVEIGR